VDAFGGCAVIAIGAVVIALIVAAAMHAARIERERTEALRAIAARLGLSFTREDASLDDRMSRFPMFTLGHSRRGLNLMEGAAVVGGLRVRLLMGDYRYRITRSDGKRTRTTVYNLSFAAVSPSLAVPEDLTVRAEGFLDKLGAMIGFDDIDFESSEFSKRFHVKCSDRRFAFDLFEPRMMEYFLASTPPTIHARGGMLLFDRGVRRWEPGDFDANLAWIDGFLSRVPRHVRDARLPDHEREFDPVLNPGRTLAGGGSDAAAPPPPPLHSTGEQP
jgi:hypothetical protein